MNFSGINPIALAVFAFFAIIVQVPVILVQTMGPTPNMPIAVLCIWLIYSNISIFINSIKYNSNDFEDWGTGAGWCDIDSHVSDASTLGIILVALTISCHLLYMSRPRTKKMTSRHLVYWHIFDAAIIFLIPVTQIILHPFMTLRRYSIIQSMGCQSVSYLSSPALVFHTIIPLLVSFLLLVVNFFTVLQFFTRGAESVYQALNFKEKFSVNFFWRSMILCFSIILTCVPVVIYNAIKTITNVNGTIGPFPWAHGKPPGWNTVVVFTWDMFEDKDRAIMIATQVTKIMTVFVSFSSFFCFGTGSTAVQFYSKCLGPFRSQKPYSEPIVSPTSMETSYYNEFLKDEKGNVNIHVSEYRPTSRADTNF